MKEDGEPVTLRRALPCARCPFKRGRTLAELQEACQGRPGEIPMLCLDSGCLDGRGPDYACRGFERNVERHRDAGAL